MTMKQIKEVLKKWGHAISGKKEDLLNRLTGAIESSVPVTAAAIESHESMTRLDVTAKWELLTPEDLPVVEQQNEDLTIKPPTECNTPTNPKYSFKETFKLMKFTGIYAKMSDIWKPNATGGRNRKRNLSPLRKGKVQKDLGKEQVFGSPNDDFLKCYGLNQHSHPMD